MYISSDGEYGMFYRDYWTLTSIKGWPWSRFWNKILLVNTR